MTILRDKRPSSPNEVAHKIVRIALPPSPPPDIDMTHAASDHQPLSLRRSQRGSDRVVLPTDADKEGDRIRSGSNWRQHDLQLLKVNFVPDEESSLDMLDVEDEWSPTQCQRVETLAKQLSSVTLEMLKSSDNDDDIEENSPDFPLFFRQLKSLLSDNVVSEQDLILPARELTIEAPQPLDVPSIPPEYSPSISRKRPNSLTLTTSTPTKVRHTSDLSEKNTPHTPDQPTQSKNPDYSGDSFESVNEDNTKQMIRTFIETILYLLRRDFEQITWTSYCQKCRLNVLGQERLSFRLGKSPKQITAINDGCIVLQYSRSNNRNATWGINGDNRVIKSIISIETKRKSQKGTQAEWRHAGQIFCEMLGQVCHPELYSINPNEFLETFVINVRHTTARVFYCKFPVSYLRNIAKYGAKYRSQVPSAQGVHLQHTKQYQLRDPIQRDEFFRLICKLIWYSSSGKSRIPFLWNHPENAINTGHWLAFNVYDDLLPFWTEPLASWGEPVYPEDMDVEEQSSPDEESGSEFLPAGSSSE